MDLEFLLINGLAVIVKVAYIKEPGFILLLLSFDNLGIKANDTLGTKHNHHSNTKVCGVIVCHDGIQLVDPRKIAIATNLVTIWECVPEKTNKVFQHVLES